MSNRRNLAASWPQRLLTVAASAARETRRREHVLQHGGGPQWMDGASASPRLLFADTRPRAGGSRPLRPGVQSNLSRYRLFSAARHLPAAHVFRFTSSAWFFRTTDHVAGRACCCNTTKTPRKGDNGRQFRQSFSVLKKRPSVYQLAKFRRDRAIRSWVIAIHWFS